MLASKSINAAASQPQLHSSFASTLINNRPSNNNNKLGIVWILDSSKRIHRNNNAERKAKVIKVKVFDKS